MLRTEKVFPLLSVTLIAAAVCRDIAYSGKGKTGGERTNSSLGSRGAEFRVLPNGRRRAIKQETVQRKVDDRSGESGGVARRTLETIFSRKTCPGCDAIFTSNNSHVSGWRAMAAREKGACKVQPGGSALLLVPSTRLMGKRIFRLQKENLRGGGTDAIWSPLKSKVKPGSPPGEK